MALSETANSYKIKRGSRVRIFDLDRSLDIARSLVFVNDGRECISVTQERTIVYSSEYLNAVKALDPKKRGEHIDSIARYIRCGKEVIFQKPAAE